MVDEIWFDWQDKSLKNEYSCGGGSMSVFGTNLTLFTMFPTRLPPHLSASGFIQIRVIYVKYNIPPFSPSFWFGSAIPGGGL